MKALLCSLLLMLTIPAFATDIEDIRKHYIRAISSMDESEKLCKKLEKTTTDEPLKLAYLAAAQALMAKNSWNPYNKMSHLNKAMETFKKAIAASPNDAEIRFLRFSVEHYLPSFLGYPSHLNADKAIIISNISRSPLHVQKVIRQFMLDCGRCTAAEKEVLQALEV